MAKTSSEAKRQTSTTNVILIGVLVSLASLSLAGYMAKSLIGSIQLNAKILQKKSLAATTLKNNLTAAPQLTNAFEQLGVDKQTLIAHSLPIDSDYPGLIALLERISQVSGLTLKSIAPTTGAGTSLATRPSSEAASSATAHDFGYSLTTEGSYDSLKALLGNLELSSRPMKLTHMNISGTGGKLSIELAATTYYMDSASLDITKEVVK